MTAGGGGGGRGGGKRLRLAAAAVVVASGCGGGRRLWGATVAARPAAAAAQHTWAVTRLIAAHLGAAAEVSSVTVGGSGSRWRRRHSRSWWRRGRWQRPTAATDGGVGQRPTAASDGGVGRRRRARRASAQRRLDVGGRKRAGASAVIFCGGAAPAAEKTDTGQSRCLCPQTIAWWRTRRQAQIRVYSDAGQHCS